MDELNRMVPSESPSLPSAANPYEPEVYRRRLLLPALLFVLTCLSTFWAGCAQEASPAILLVLTNARGVGRIVAAQWRDGLSYMLAVMAILGAHEMGHFLMALRHRVMASWPFFVPFPISPVGTMGAVIGMQSYQANRKQIFDIGIAGPLAGLLVAVPITWFGIQRAEVAKLTPQQIRAIERAKADPDSAGIALPTTYHDPLLVKLLIRQLRPDAQGELILNPLLMAGWVGLLITGLNMMPVSQLDGGHVSYALFGRRAVWLARAFILAAVTFMVVEQVFMWSLMLILVFFLRIDHPRTADDNVPLGWGRTILGYASLSIPVLCFPPYGISQSL